MKNTLLFKKANSLLFLSFTLLVLFVSEISFGQVTEGFESGLPTSYGTTLTNRTLGSGSWGVLQVIAGTTGVNSGTKSAQLQSATASQLISPSITGGVGSISFYVTSSTTSGGFQVNLSTDGGTTWSAAVGSPFTTGTTKTLKTIVVNNSLVNKIQIYRTAGTIYIDDFSTTISSALGTQTITFGALSTKTFGNSDFSPGATSASSGTNTITYVSSNTAVATIVSGNIHIVGAGSSTITASQAASTNYSAATDVSQTLTVNKASQTITFNSLPNKLDTDVPFTLGATATSSLPISYSSSDSSVISISGTTATIVGVGAATITASQSGDNNYNAANATQDQIVVSTALTNQTITFEALSAVTYGDASFTLSATSDSGLSVNYTSSDPTIASISGNVVSIFKPGSVNITASQAGNSSYNAATPVNQNLIINQKTLTVSGATVTSRAYDTTNVATITGATLVGVVGLDAVNVSGGGTFADASPGIDKPVTAALTLNGADASKYSITQPTELSATISQAIQTITFAALANKSTADVPFTLSASSTSGLSIAFSSSNTAVATISGNTVTIVGAGTTTITASQIGDGNYSAAFDVTQNLTVTLAASVILGWDMNALTGGTNNFGNSPLIPSTSNSNVTNSALIRGSGIVTTGSAASRGWGGLGWNYTTADLAIAANRFATFSTNVNAGYSMSLTSLNPFGYRVSSTGASSVALQYKINSGSFTTITTFTSLLTSSSGSTFPTTDLTGITALQNLPSNSVVTFRIVPFGASGATGTFYIYDTANTTSNDLVLNGFVSQLPAPSITSSLTANGAVGTSFSYATIASNSPSSYAAAGLPSGLSIATATGVISGTPTNVGSSDVTLSATNATGTDTKTLVITVGKGTQTITFGTLASKTYGDSSFTLNGVSSSGLTLSYTSSNLAVATISGNTVTIIGAGTTSITASQIGNDNYLAATSVSQDLLVNKASQTITFESLSSKLVSDTAFTLSASTTSLLAVSFSSSNESVITISGNTATIVGVGTATITASQSGNDNYNAAANVTQDQIIVSASLINQTIMFGALSAVTYGDASFSLNATGGASGNEVTYSSSNSSIASISGNVVSSIKPGTVTITASQAGNSSYNTAPSVEQELIINKKSLTVSNVVITDKIYDGSLTAIISSATLNGIVGTNDVVSLSNSAVFADANAGNGITVTPNFTLNSADAGKYLLTQPTGILGNIIKANQTITFGALASKTFGDATFNLIATGGASGNAVTFLSSNPAIASITGNTVTILAGGTVTITASQAGSLNYNGATDVSQSLVIAPKVQTILFSALGLKHLNDSSFDLTAVANSGATPTGLPITYVSSNTEVATISGSTVTLVGIGSTTITATQAGNDNYLPATFSQTLKVITPAIAAWNVNSLNQSATATATTFVNLDASLNTMTRGATAAASVGGASFRTVGFKNEGIATTNTDYFQVTLKPIENSRLSIATIDATFNGTTGFYATPGVTSQFAYSLDATNFTLINSPVQSSSLTMATVDVSGISALQNVPSSATVTLRYYASGQTTTGGWGFYSPTATSDAFSIGGQVKLNTTPSPLADDQDFCGSSTVANLVAEGTDLKWYATATGGTPLTSDVALVSGNYYVTQTIDGFESLVRTQVLVTVNGIISQPVSTSICKVIGGTAVLSVVSANPNATYQWETQTPTGTTWANVTNPTTGTAIYTGGTNSTLNIRKSSLVLPLSLTKYRVKVTGSCSTETSEVVTITDAGLPTEVVGAITSTTTTATGFAAATLAVGPFVGTQTTVSYRITAFIGSGLTYYWTVPAGVSIVGQASGVTSVTQDGVNANVLNVNFNNVSSGAGTVGSISVQAQNASGCKTTAKSVILTKALPTAPATLVMSNGVTATAITSFAKYMGTPTVLTLTAAASATATSYSWELPAGVTQLSGGNTSVITVNFAGVTSSNTDSYTTTAGVLTYVLRIGVKSVNGVGNSITANSALENPITSSTAKLLTLTAIAPAAPTALVLNNGDTFVPATDPKPATTKIVPITIISKLIGQGGTYRLSAAVPATTIANRFTWELPACVTRVTSLTVDTVVGGLDSTDPFIFVKFNGTNPTAGSIYFGVKAVNGIGSSNSSTANATVEGEYANSAFKLLKLVTAVPAAPTALVLNNGDTIIPATETTLETTKIVPITIISNLIGQGGIYRLSATVPTATTLANSFTWELPAFVTRVTGLTDAAPVDGLDSTAPFIFVRFNGATNTNPAAGVIYFGVKAVNDIGSSMTDNSAASPATDSKAKLLKVTAGLPVAPTTLLLYDVASATPTTAVAVVSKYIGTTTTLKLTAAVSALANSYSWELPEGVNRVTDLEGLTTTLSRTSNDPFIYVNFANVPHGATAISLYLGVKAENSVGSSATDNQTKPLTPITDSKAKLLKVTAGLPVAVAKLAGSLSVCSRSEGYSYTITAPLGAASYIITAPVGSVISSVSAPANNSNVLTTSDLEFKVVYTGTTAFLSTDKSLVIKSVNTAFGETSKSFGLTKLATCPTGRFADPTSVSKTSVAPFDVKSYPNPSTSDFQFDFTTASESKVELRVYDMIGKLLELRQMNSNEVNTQRVGNNYPSGIYNVIVTQDANVKTLRVIKK